jgi:hypothetical protein
MRSISVEVHLAAIACIAITVVKPAEKEDVM